MIEYVEVRNAQLELIAIIDYAISIIWETEYYGAGFFEVYAQLTDGALAALVPENYVTRPDNDACGIIETIEITDDVSNGKCIIASGRMAKSILDRRHIYKLTGNSNKATVLRGLVETEVREVITDNAINCTWNTARNLPLLTLGAVTGLDKRIRDESGAAAQKQTSYGNLLQYTDELLQEYQYGARTTIDKDNNKLLYSVYAGIDRSVDNAEGNAPLIFSDDFDNLSTAIYKYDTSGYKNTALVGGAGEGSARFYIVLNDAAAGMARRETFIDDDSIARTYTDDSETEQTYTDAEYTVMLQTDALQKMAEFVDVETFEGEIDMANTNYALGIDYDLGDVVTVQDNTILKYINARITTITETQDDSGYNIAVKYGV